MAENVNLVIFPQIREGEEIDVVKERLCSTLSVDAATVDTWYATQSPTAILKDVDEVTGGKYADAINKCGAQCNLSAKTSPAGHWRT